MTFNPIESAKNIFAESEAIQSYAKVLMFSGGKDSQAAFEICRILDVKLDAIIHVNTRTGIKETTEYVRAFAESTGIKFIEADSGAAYENYVLRKGFFGVGTGYQSAHSFAFHVCKRDAYTSALAGLRERKKNRPILLVNGARIAESDNRKANMGSAYIRPDRKGSKNIWVNPLHYWSDEERNTFLSEQKCPINPVSKMLCRSGECMCGTTQGKNARLEASAMFPEWGDWLDRLEAKVKEKFPWGWGDPVPQTYLLEKQGQLNLFDDSPMCSSCRLSHQEGV